MFSNRYTLYLIHLYDLYDWYLFFGSEERTAYSKTLTIQGEVQCPTEVMWCVFHIFTSITNQYNVGGGITPGGIIPAAVLP